MKHNRLRLAVASALTLLVAACSQVPTPQAQTDTPLSPQFGTKEYDEDNLTVVSKSLNSVFVAGTTSFRAREENGGKGNDVYLRRYGRDGKLIWNITFGEVGYNSLTSLSVANRNHIYVTGVNQLQRSYKGFLEQYSADGKLVWRQELSTPTAGEVSFTTAVPDAAGNIVLTGTSKENGDSFIDKFSSRGDLMWTKTYSGQYFSDIQIDPSGNLYTFDDTNSKLSKYTATGQLVWQKRPQEISGAENMSVVENSLYLAGSDSWYDSESGNLQDEAFVVKFDLSGKLTWKRSFSTEFFDLAYAVTADSQGAVYVTGLTAGTLGSKNRGEEDVFVRKFSSSGKVLWTKQFGGSKSERGTAVAALSSNEIYIAGETSDDLGAGNRGFTDAFLARFDRNGKRIWTH